jgi:hypothetical protein
MRALRQGGRLASLSLGRKGDLLDLFTESARSFLDGWFESEVVKAAFAMRLWATTPVPTARVRPMYSYTIPSAR